jgi:hypothetical protein
MEHQSPTLVDASGFPIATRSLLLSLTAANSPFLDFTGLDDTFPRYVIEGDNIKAGTDKDQLNALVSIAGVFYSGEDDYIWAARNFGDDGTSGQDQSPGSGDERIATCRDDNDGWGVGQDQTGDVTFTITRGSSANLPRIWGTTVNLNSGADLQHTTFVGSYTGVTSLVPATSGIDGVRLKFNTGIIVQGNFRLYGVE